MASPRAVPSAASSASRSISRSFHPASFVGTPPVPQIPSRGQLPSTSLPRSASNASPAPLSTGTPAHRPSDSSLGAKAAVVPPAASSALTASLPSKPESPASPAPEPRPEPMRRGSSQNLLAPGGGRTSASGHSTPVNDSSFSNLADITDEEKAKVLRRHLVSAEERLTSNRATPGGQTPEEQEAEASGVSAGSPPADEAFPIPFDAPGGDVTHDLYKWQHEHRARPGRSASFSHIPLDRSVILEPTLAHIKEPGGFRRNFVVARAQERGEAEPVMLRNVIDFLFLYGHFAGEDLGEDEDEDDEDDEVAAEAGLAGPSERTPLLRGTTHRGKHKRTKSLPGQGTATMTQAVLMLLKGFVGTGILFMGKAFFNGGILFSSIVLLSIAGISLWSFLLLVQTYMKVPGSFGDIGGELYGRHMRLTILASIAISQIGFVAGESACPLRHLLTAAYTIFIAENLQAFIMAVSDCKTYVPTPHLIFAQLAVFLPLAMIRNLAKLSGTALVADAFILIGLVYIGINETTILAKHGIANVVLFNKVDFPLLIGTAVFAFEGIGLVIPITESMKEPQKFPRALSGVMAVIAVLFAGFGVLGYAAYGSDIQTVVIVNLPQDDKFVQAVQFLYSVAILLSIPLQLFPAVRIMENGLFSRSGKHNPRVKWQKNLFRAGTVLFCSLLSWAGSSELDKFVSLIGSFACIPLCFIYPPMLHLKGVATTRRERALDYGLIAFGAVAGLYTTVQTVRSLFEPGTGGGPRFGKCEIPRGV
ncbi:hypothetical protein Q5752_000005 [Cryptotrichosporon argae]